MYRREPKHGRPRTDTASIVVRPLWTTIVRQSRALILDSPLDAASNTAVDVCSSICNLIPNDVVAS